MNWPKQYQSRIESILGDRFHGRHLKLSFKFDTAEEVRKHLTDVRQMQKELRLVKKDVTQDMKRVRSSFAAQASNVKAGFFASLGGKGAAIHDRAQKRERLRKQEEAALVPYENVSRTIDEMLLKLDGLKIQLEQWLTDHK